MGVGAARAVGAGLGRALTIFAALTCLGAAPWDGVGPSISTVRFGGDQNQTRIVIELNRSTHGELAASDGSGELRLQLDDLSVPQAMDGVGEGLVRTWRVQRSAGGEAGWSCGPSAARSTT